MTKEESKSRLKKFYDAGYVSLVITIFIALYIRIAVFEPFMVPSGSMKPNLIEGDYIAIYKLPYGVSKYSIPFAPFDFSGRYFVKKTPERGDIIVFKNPKNKSQYYVKRLIGIPGDKVQVINGDLLITGSKLEKKKEGEYLDPRVDYIAQIDREYLNKDFSYLTLDTYDSESDHTKEFLVPEKHYFFMGDNRDNSKDSRESLGFVQEDYIIGKAEYIVFSNDYVVEPSWNIVKFFTSFKSDRFIKNLYK